MLPFTTTLRFGPRGADSGTPCAPLGALLRAREAARLYTGAVPIWAPSPEPPQPERHPDVQRALGLLSAIDAGGVPLSPARINDIGRRLGLEVSVHARPEATIQRIREAVDRIRS